MPKKILLIFLLLAIAAPRAHSAEVTAGQVQQAIEKGVGYLRRSGVFNQRAQMGVGQNALAILAALHCGVQANDPDVVRGADFCANPQNWNANVYHVGAVAAALAAVDPVKYRATLMKCADYLIEAQNADGGWRYASQRRYAPDQAQTHQQWLAAAMQKIEMWRDRPQFAQPANQMSDHSCTQYGLLGLRACEDSGIYVPAATWKAAENYLVKTQMQDGGWSYTNSGRSYGSMTGAGLGSLYIVGAKLHQRAEKCGEYEQHKSVAAGLDWLIKNYSVTTNPGNGNYYGYYLYALERCFSFSGRRRIGGRDWYAEGAAHLVARQQADGSWSGGRGFGGGGQLDTIFFLLFLGKASANVMIQKLEYGAEWNTDYYDAEHLALRTSKELGLKATWQVVNIDEPIENMLEAPILYISGHGQLNFTEPQRARLREFCERGGTIIADACCSEKAFDTAFREEMKKIFPDSTLEKLTEEHPVYLRPHKITEEKNLVWEGVTFGCRVAVLYSQKDLSCAWDGNIHNADLSIDEKDAMRIGVNAAAYAMGYRPLKDKLDKLEDAEKVPQVKDDGRVARGALIFAQLKHDGDSNPDPGAAAAMMHYYSKATGARVSVARVEINPLENLEKYPFIYITGHNEFKYNEKEIAALREYFERGGFMFADACCGKKKFDKSFRELVAQIFPNNPLQSLPLDHKLFDMKYKIKTVEYKPTLLAELPEGEKDKPHLEAIVIDGRAVLVYSPYDLGCAFESFPHPGARAVVRESAEKLLSNILIYGMTE